MSAQVIVLDEKTTNPIEGVRILIGGEVIGKTNESGRLTIQVTGGETIIAEWNGESQWAYYPDDSYDYVNFWFDSKIESSTKKLLSGARLWFVVFILLIALFLIIKKYI
jgi:hypothetical protein